MRRSGSFVAETDVRYPTDTSYRPAPGLSPLSAPSWRRRGTYQDFIVNSLLRKCIAFDAASACRVFDIARAARETPDAPAVDFIPEDAPRILMIALRS